MKNLMQPEVREAVAAEMRDMTPTPRKVGT
jgi:hypothetical protein